MWTIFKVFIEFVTILLLFYVLVFWLRGVWDLNSPTRDRTHTPCTGRRSLNHWTTKVVPMFLLFIQCLIEVIPELVSSKVFTQAVRSLGIFEAGG